MQDERGRRDHDDGVPLGVRPARQLHARSAYMQRVMGALRTQTEFRWLCTGRRRSSRSAHGRSPPAPAFAERERALASLGRRRFTRTLHRVGYVESDRAARDGYALRDLKSIAQEVPLRLNRQILALSRWSSGSNVTKGRAVGRARRPSGAAVCVRA
jgi:hypothetical protein